MATFHIQLLGNFHVAEDGTAVIGIDTARLQSFFCFLLIHSQKPQSRHYIASVLWQNSTESQARTNLRKYIHQLRSKLPAIEQLFYIDGNVIQWRADAPAVVDVHEFGRYLAQADAYQKLSHHDEVIAALEQTVTVYQGDLLPACYEEWIASPREQLASQYIQALDQLAQLLERQRDYDKAIHYVRKLLEQDALRESSYRRLIHLYALAGNRAKAIETYRQCAEVLRREMDIEPGFATRTVYERAKGMRQPVVDEVQPVPRREQVTILFADIAGFGIMAERYDSQVVFADLNAYINLLHSLIQEGGGQVVKRMGDALLAMFERADDALQVAYTIQDALWGFNEKQEGNGRPLFQTRIGIATGDVLLAHLDVDGQHEIEVMGKCVNTAVHLQQVTPVDSIALDQLTYTQCKSLVQGSISETLLTSEKGNEQVYIVNR